MKRKSRRQSAGFPTSRFRMTIATRELGTEPRSTQKRLQICLRNDVLTNTISRGGHTSDPTMHSDAREVGSECPTVKQELTANKKAQSQQQLRSRSASATTLPSPLTHGSEGDCQLRLNVQPFTDCTSDATHLTTLQHNQR